MSLQNICVEVRKHLHCINVFLQFEEGLQDATSLLRISVKPEQLSLHNNEQDVNISLQQYFKLKSDTLSGLVVEQRNACFRLGIDNVQIFPRASTPVNTVPVLNECLTEAIGQAVGIVCANCKCQLNNTLDGGEQKVTRFREFPSSGVDFNELFCHNAPNFQEILVPQNTDLFYGYEFIVINKQLVKTSTREKQQQIYCSRCLQHLGETILEQRAVKLWANVLKVRTSTGFDAIFKNNINMKPTAHFLHEVLRDCFFDEHTWMLRTMANIKVVLHTTSADCVQHHLLLHIFIGNLDPEVDEKLLYDTFSAFGVILQTPKIMRDPETGNSKGFAFINFASFEASDAAMDAMNGQYLCNRPISVSYAFKKDSKGERHGSAAERLLAAQNPSSQSDRPHQLFADAPVPSMIPVMPGQMIPPPLLAPPPPPSGPSGPGGMLPPPPPVPPPQAAGFPQGIPPPPLPPMGGNQPPLPPPVGIPPPPRMIPAPAPWQTGGGAPPFPSGMPGAPPRPMPPNWRPPTGFPSGPFPPRPFNGDSAPVGFQY